MVMSLRNSGAASRGLLTLAALAIAGAAVLGASHTSQAAGEPMKIGILPFGDATASGNTRVGADIGGTMLSEMARLPTLVPRLLVTDGSMAANDLTAAKAVAMGREQDVDFVFMGTVLDAKTEESNRSGWVPSIRGQSASVRVRRVKATVILQGDVYEVASATRVLSERVTGTESDSSVTGTAYTKFGAWGNDDYRAFLESPLGAALQTAIAEMTKKIAAIKRSSS